MTLGRIMRMYGDKSPLYSFSVCIFCFGLGCICVKYGKDGFANVFVYALWLLLGIHFVDAIIKSIVYIKKNFRIDVKCK